MQKNYSISAVVLSKNSEKKIGKCLESLKGWADEIILVDGQSIDNTVKIAQGFGAVIVSHPFLGSFAAERNSGSDRAKSDWVLQLDSDEIVSDDFKKKCGEILSGTKYTAFKFHRKNVFLGHEFRYGGWYHWSQHLFRRGSAHYEGRVHEKMIVAGETGYLDADILHVPFDSISEFIERQNRYTDLQARDIMDSEKDLSPKKIRYNLKVKPGKLFRKMYLKNKGYREGVHGLVFSVLFAWVHFLKWAKVWEMVKDKKNILVIRNDRFGEFLLNIPAIRALKESFPDSKITLAVDPQIKELAGHVPGVDEVIVWRSGKHSLSEILKFSSMLKKKAIDVALIMNASKDSNIAVRFAGIPERVGYARKWDFLLTKTIEDRKHLEEKHEVEYNLELVRLVGVSDCHCEKARSAGFVFHPGVENVFHPGVEYVAIHPWTSDAVKQWPIERFRELALRIVKELGTDVVIVGGNVEPLMNTGFDNLDKRISNLTGKTSLLQLAEVLKNSALLISGDSGPVHLAASVGTPVIVLFRNDMPGKGPKRWAPWGKGHVVIAKSRLLDISVDEIVKAVKHCVSVKIH